MGSERTEQEGRARDEVARKPWSRPWQPLEHVVCWGLTAAVLVPAATVLIGVLLLFAEELDLPDGRELRREGRDLLRQLEVVEPGGLKALVRHAESLPPEFWESEAWPGRTWVFGWKDDVDIGSYDERTPLSFRPRPGPWLAIGEYCYGNFDDGAYGLDVSTGYWHIDS